jgi:NAD(P)-dependent dehydrogenase (short-subunit alcohol dehydrogenase family)
VVNAVTRATETFGHIDILVNAAGIDVPGPIVQLATSDWDYVLDVNLRAPFLLAKAVFPSMSQARHDHQHLLSGRQTRLGECLSVLRFQIWRDRLHPSPRC